MGAIGDYVHYSYAGYEAHGTSRNGTFKAWKSQRQKVLKSASKLSKSSLNKQERQQLEQLLTGMMSTAEPADAITNQARQNVLDKMEQQFNDTLQEIDWSTGDVKMHVDRESVIGRAKDAKNIDDLIKRVDKLEKIMTQEAQQGILIEKKAKKQVKEIQKYYHEIANKIGQYEKSNQLSVNAYAQIADDLEKQRKALNELIAKYAAYPAVSLQKGTFFERLIEQVPLVAEQLGIEALTKVVGDDYEEVSFDQSQFSGAFTSTALIGNVLEKTSSSQGKIDVELQWDDKQIGLSAKNIAIDPNKYQIHLVTGSSLLYMIQDRDTDFVNHFLNLFAKHGRPGAITGAFRTSKELMKDEMKLILFFKALTGANYKRKAANLFVVNDSTTGRVYVKSIEGLIDKVAEDINKYVGITLNGNTFNTSIKQFNNPSLDNSKDRISALLMDVHARKVNVSLKPSAFI